ncbi:MAG: serine/threonine-protein kinase, partial [Myxococcota bacterium]|nr:serine/threonine-protein kinase [Myxococcota bacterium]
MRALIGSGGMGDVWLANHREQDLEVAIKVIGAHVDESSDVQEAFAREARAVAGLSHSGIVGVYDYGLLDGRRPFLVMEYAPKGSLERLIPRMDWSLMRQILLDVCDALAHAHARGIVHKDLKPGNVLLSGEEHVTTLLTDFGVAHALAGHVGDISRTQDLTGEPSPRSAGAGTPAYMPPEQLRGHWREFG